MIMIKNKDMEYKVVITDSQSEINSWLEKGWKIQSVTAQHIAGGGQISYTTKAPFCFVISKSK